MGMTQNSGFAAALEAVGVQLPADAADAVAAWQALMADEIGEPLAELRASLASGEIAAKQAVKAARQAAADTAARKELAAVKAGCEQPLGLRFARSVQDNADAIITGLRDPFAEAAEQLTAAAAVIPADVDTASLLAMGLPDAATHWPRLGEAAGILTGIANLRLRLSREYSVPLPSSGACSFIAAAGSIDRLRLADALFDNRHLDGHELPPTQGGIWRRLVDAGFELRLNTTSEAFAVAAPPTVAAEVAA